MRDKRNGPVLPQGPRHFLALSESPGKQPAGPRLRRLSGAPRTTDARPLWRQAALSRICPPAHLPARQAPGRGTEGRGERGGGRDAQPSRPARQAPGRPAPNPPPSALSVPVGPLSTSARQPARQRARLSRRAHFGLPRLTPRGRASSPIVSAKARQGGALKAAWHVDARALGSSWPARSWAQERNLSLLPTAGGGTREDGGGGGGGRLEI